MGAGFSRTIWKSLGWIQCKQCRISNAAAMRRGLLLPLFSCIMLPYFQGFLSLCEGSKPNDYSVLNNFITSLWQHYSCCKALFIEEIYIGEGRSQRELRFVCVTPSFWLLIVYDMGESCSGHFHYYFHLDFFVLLLNLTGIICDVKGKSGVSQSLVEFIPWVWEKKRVKIKKIREACKRYFSETSFLSEMMLCLALDI